MTLTISITNNWQLHVPLAARKISGLEKSGKATLTVKKGELVIKPKTSKILSLGGSLHSVFKKNPIDLDNIRDNIDYSSA